jgi:hypothetical protein
LILVIVMAIIKSAKIIVEIDEMKIEIGSGVMTRNSESTCIIFGNNVLPKSEVGIHRKNDDGNSCCRLQYSTVLQYLYFDESYAVLKPKYSAGSLHLPILVTTGRVHNTHVPPYRCLLL